MKVKLAASEWGTTFGDKIFAILKFDYKLQDKWEILLYNCGLSSTASRTISSIFGVHKNIGFPLGWLIDSKVPTLKTFYNNLTLECFLFTWFSVYNWLASSVYPI